MPPCRRARIRRAVTLEEALALIAEKAGKARRQEAGRAPRRPPRSRPRQEAGRPRRPPSQEGREAEDSRNSTALAREHLRAERCRRQGRLVRGTPLRRQVARLPAVARRHPALSSPSNPDKSGKREIAKAFALKGEDRIGLKDTLRRASRTKGCCEKNRKRLIAPGRPARRRRARHHRARRGRRC